MCRIYNIIAACFLDRSLSNRINFINIDIYCDISMVSLSKKKPNYLHQGKSDLPIIMYNSCNHFKYILYKMYNCDII